MALVKREQGWRSKARAKQFMMDYGIPTAAFEVFDNAAEAYRFLQKASYPLVVKADGLASGKGVIIAQDYSEANEAVRLIMEEKVFQSAGNSIVIEEYLEGEEVSVFAITDGESYITLPSVQDHKAIYEGIEGPTRGMGAYSPAPVLTEELAKIVEQSIQAADQRLEKEGISYRGDFWGLIITADGPSYLNLMSALAIRKRRCSFRDSAPICVPCFMRQPGVISLLHPPLAGWMMPLYVL